MVSKPIDDKEATYANGGAIGFAMAGPEEAEAWHNAGVANGGTAIEDPPGIRHGGSAQIYLAYLRDPDGNKLCALHRIKAALTAASKAAALVVIAPTWVLARDSSC